MNLACFLRLWALLALLPFVAPSVAAAADTQAPNCQIRAYYVQPQKSATKFTFLISADDNEGVDHLEFREAISNNPLSEWRPWPKELGNRITITLDCDAFQFQVRAVDTSGNVSSAQALSFKAPFPNKPEPTPQPIFAKPKFLTGSVGQTFDLKIRDVDGDGKLDFVRSDGQQNSVDIRLGDGAGGGTAAVTLPFSTQPRNLALGRIFGPDASAANDDRLDLAVAAGFVYLFANNGGQGASGLQLNAPNATPYLQVPGYAVTSVAVQDLNGDGWEDIIAGGSGPGQAVIAVFLNRGVINGVHDGFTQAGIYPAGVFSNDLVTADVDRDGFADIIGLDEDGKQIVIVRSHGSGSFGDPVLLPTQYAPTAIALGDLTSDGAVDIAIYGQKYLAASSTQVMGLEVLRNTKDSNDQFGAFESIEAHEFYRVPKVPANASFKGDVQIADVTLDGVPEIVAVHPSQARLDLVRLVSVRNAQGKFIRFQLEGATQIPLTAGPIQVAVGQLNADSKPDVAIGGAGDKHIGVLLNVKGGSKKSALTLSLRARSDSDEEGKLAAVGDQVTYTVGYSNDTFDDATNVTVSAIVPPGVDVEFVDANNDERDDNFGFDPIFTAGRITAVSWEIGNLPIGAAGQKRLRVKVSDSVKVGANLTVSAKVRSNTGTRTIKSPKLLVTTSVTVEAMAQQTTVHPGGLVEYRIKVRNRAGYPAKNVYVFAPVPDNAGLQSGIIGPAFLGDDFQPAVRIDGITGKPVVTPKAEPFIDFFTGNPVNPGWTADRRKVAWFLGGMAPKSEQLLRFYVRLTYDAEPTGSLALGDLTAFQLVLGKGKGPLGIEFGAAQQLGTRPALSIVPAPPGASRPALAFALHQEAAGTLTDTGSGERLVTVTTDAKPVPGTSPARKTNEIQYTATYVNIGSAVAGYLRAHLMVPPGTRINRSSVLVDNVPVPAKQVKVVRYDIEGLVEVPEIEDEVTEGAFLLVALPFLEANFPSTPGSAKTVKYRVIVKPTARLDDEILSLGFLQSDELRNAVFTTPSLVRARVVRPVILEKLKAQRTPAFSEQDNEQFTVDAFIRNSGGVAASGVEVVYDIPAGAKLVDAFFLDANLLRVGGTIEKPSTGATSGLIRFKAGTVAPGAIVRTQVVYRTNHSAVPQSGVDANSITPQITAADNSNRFVARVARNRLVVSADHPESTFSVPMRVKNRTFVAQKVSRSVRPGELLTFTLFWGNLSSDPAGAGGVTFPIPENTTFVSATPTVALTSFNHEVVPAYNAELGTVFWGTTAQPHQAVIATVTVRVSDQPGQSTIRSDKLNIRGDQSSLVTVAPVSIPILGANTAENAAIGSAAGSSAQVAIGNAFDVSAANTAFQNDVKLIATESAIFGIGGADYLHLKQGPIIIPLGGGNIVAAGAGNIVAAGGGNIVAAGGGNIVAAGGGNIVAAGAGNIVAAGAGNLIGIQGMVSNLTQSNLYNLTASIVAAGGGNLNLIPGASIVAAGAGNIVAAGGGNLIGPDGASLINNDNGLRLSASLAPQVAGMLGNGVETGLLVSDRIGGLVGQDSAAIASVSTGSLVQGSSGGLIGNNGNTLIGPDGATLIGPDGATLIGNNGNTLVAAGAGNIVAAGGGNLIGNNGNTLTRREAK